MDGKNFFSNAISPGHLSGTKEYFNKRSVSNVFKVDVLKKKISCKLAFFKKNWIRYINVTTKTLLLLKNHSTPHEGLIFVVVR